MKTRIGKRRLFANDRFRISVTNACPLSCPYCSNEGQSHRSRHDLEIGKLEQLVSKIAGEDIYVRKINVTGGEPILHEQLGDICKILRPICEELTVNTNGVLLTESMISRLAKHGVTCFKFGLDTANGGLSKPELRSSASLPPSAQLIVDGAGFVRLLREGNGAVIVYCRSLLKERTRNRIAVASGDEGMDELAAQALSEVRVATRHRALSNQCLLEHWSPEGDPSALKPADESALIAALASESRRTIAASRAEKVLLLLDYARSLVPRTSVNMVVSDFNAGQWLGIGQWIVEKGIDKAELLELIPHDFRAIGCAPSSREPLENVLRLHMHAGLVNDVRYNPGLAKYIALAPNERLVIQYCYDFCRARVCQRLWSRINSRLEFVGCFKCADNRRIDMSSELAPQIVADKERMCNGPDGYLPRAVDGEWLRCGAGPYTVPTPIGDFGLSEADP